MLYLCTFFSCLCRLSCGMCECQSPCRSTRGTIMNMPTFRSTSVSMRGFCWQVGGAKTCSIYIRDLSYLRCFPALIGNTKHSICISSSSVPLSVGQDCYTRLWSLKDGHLLRTIPSPHPAANDLIPSVVFSSKLGGCRGLPGLLMAVKHDLYYFPYNTDYQDGGEQQAGF